jgi:hypothetical protein
LEKALAQRVKDQKPLPNGETVLRTTIAQLRSGAPNYSSMSDGLSDAVRKQLPEQRRSLDRLGEIEAVTFKGVGPGGADIYEIKFEHGSAEWRILIGREGRIEALFTRPIS